MKLISLLTLLSFISCGFKLGQIETKPQQPLKYSYLPKKIVFDNVPILEQQKQKSKQLKQSLTNMKIETYNPIPILEEGECVTKNGTKYQLKPGLLFDEKKVINCNIYKIEAESCNSELYITKGLYNDYIKSSQEAEARYQQEIIDWQNKAKRSWWERHDGAIGLFTGFFSSLIGMFLLIKANNKL